MKVIKRIGMAILCVPVLAVAVFIVFELVGAVVNHAATAVQTNRLKNVLLQELPGVEILDTYSETGNTSGTGNHVDMLSVVLFRTDRDEEEIYDRLKDEYDFDGWGCWFVDAAAVREEHEKDGYAFSFLEHMEVPADLTGCYLFYLNESAPFAGNMEGH